MATADAMDTSAVVATRKMLKQKTVMNKGINGSTRIMDIADLNPQAADLLMEIGFHCMGCHMSMIETLEEGCIAHGMSEKDIKELIKRLNKK